MFGLHQVKALVTQFAVHLLQAHPFHRAHSHGEIRRTGTRLVSITVMEVRKAVLLQLLPQGEDFIHILHAGAAHIVSPLVRITVHFYQRALVQHLGQTLEVASVSPFKPIHYKVNETLCRKNAIQVQIPQADALHGKLTVALPYVHHLVYLGGHNVVHLPADPYFMVIFIGIVVLHQARHLQQRGVIGKIQVLYLVGPGVHQVPQEPDVTLHQMRHPPARLPTQVTVHLLHQLGLPQPRAQFLAQQTGQVLQLRLAKAIQNGM